MVALVCQSRSTSLLLRPCYSFLQTAHFVKSRAHSPRPTRKIIATMALRRAILMKADPVVSLHAHRLFSGRACSCRKDPCSTGALCVPMCTSKDRACLHEGGGPRVGEVTCGKLPHLSCKRDHNKMRDYMDRRVTPPKRVTSPTCGPPPPCKQALSILKAMDHYSFDGVGRGGGGRGWKIVCRG